MNVHDWLLNRFPPERRSDRRCIGYLEAWVSIVGNVVLFVFKLLSGLALNSIALVADAFHSLSDVLTSLVVLAGFAFGGRPADSDHPHGHGRIEHVATLVIAIMLLGVAISMGKGSIDRVLKPQPVRFSLAVLVLLLLSAAFKEWMARFSIHLGRKIHSKTLLADAWHHRSDAIAAGLVAVGLAVSPLGFFRLDGVLGLAVTALLLWVAWDLGRDSVNDLIGRAPDPQTVELIRAFASSQPDVLSCHGISIHDYASRAEATLHIVVNERISTLRAHRIAQAVETGLMEKLGGYYAISVHVDPRGEPED
jgi:cation diffusion facilitator family transporter